MPQATNGVALKAIGAQNSVEPILLAKIGWGGIGASWYSSKRVYGLGGNIISCSPSSSSKRADNRGSTGSITIVFDDSSGAMLQTIDFAMAEKSPATVYLVAAGTTMNDTIPIVNGEIAAPVIYNEGERTLTVTVETIIEAKEIGFAPTDEFSDLAPEAIGVAWPMVFGHCAHIPCPRIRRQTEGYLNIPIRLNSKIATVVDGNLVPDKVTHVQSYLDAVDIAKDTIYIRDGNLFPQNIQVKIMIENVIFSGHFVSDIFHVKESNLPAYTGLAFGPRLGVTVDEQNNPLLGWLASTTNTNPDGSKTQINLAGMWLYLINPTGTPSGYSWNVIYVCKQEGQRLEFANAPVNPKTGMTMPVDGTVKIQNAYGCMTNGLGVNAAFDFDAIIETLTYVGSFSLRGQRQGLAQSMLKAIITSSEVFWQVPSETSVKLWGVADPEIYVVSCVECSDVNAVYGHKKVRFPDGQEHRVLAPIPSSYYEIQLASNYPVNGAYATGLLFWKPLHEYKEEGWDGQVYATATSKIGPNPGDIVHYILTTYAPQIDPYHIKHNSSLHDMNFTYLRRENSVEFASKIAWLAKCALVLDSTIGYMPYLGELPLAVLTFNESNTERNSIEMGFTPTSKIKTKIVGRWTITSKDRFEPGQFNDVDQQKIYDIVQSLIDNADPRKRDDRVTVYRENINVFGEKEEQVDMFCYCDPESVQDVLSFWGHRYANSWRTVKLKTFLNAAHLIAFDAVELNYSWNTLANLRILAEVESASIDFASNTVTLSLWIPSKAGTEVFDSTVYTGPGGLDFGQWVSPD